MRRSITLKELLERVDTASTHYKDGLITAHEAYRKIVEAYTLIDIAELEEEDVGKAETD